MARSHLLVLSASLARSLILMLSYTMARSRSMLLPVKIARSVTLMLSGILARSCLLLLLLHKAHLKRPIRDLDFIRVAQLAQHEWFRRQFAVLVIECYLMPMAQKELHGISL